MSRLMYGHVLSNGVKIHYYRTGDEKPPVVMLHGLSMNALIWNRIGIMLEAFFDVVLIDARGHGLSGAPETGYSVADHVQDALNVIHELDLKKPALVGHSMGADVAFNIAAQASGLLGCVVLEDPPFREKSWEETLEQRHARSKKWTGQLHEINQMPLEQAIEYCRSLHPTWDETDCRLWAKAKQEANPLVVEYNLVPGTSWLEKAKSIQCPGLLIYSDQDLGGIVSPAVAGQITKNWKNCQVLHVPGAGHTIRNDQFIPYRDAVRKFLLQYQVF